MRRAAAILALLFCGAAPVEAERPIAVGTYRRAPIQNRGHRYWFDEWLVYTPTGWKRARFIDYYTGEHVHNFAFGQSRYIVRPCEPVVGSEL